MNYKIKYLEYNQHNFDMPITGGAAAGPPPPPLECHEPVITRDAENANDWLNEDPNNFMVIKANTVICMSLDYLRRSNTLDDLPPPDDLRVFYACNDNSQRLNPANIRNAPGDDVYFKIYPHNEYVIKPEWVFNRNAVFDNGSHIYHLQDTGDTVPALVSNDILIPGANFVGADHCNHLAPVKIYRLVPGTLADVRNTVNRAAGYVPPAVAPAVAPAPPPPIFGPGAPGFVPPPPPPFGPGAPGFVPPGAGPAGVPAGVPAVGVPPVGVPAVGVPAAGVPPAVGVPAARVPAAGAAVPPPPAGAAPSNNNSKPSISEGGLQVLANGINRHINNVTRYKILYTMNVLNQMNKKKKRNYY